MEGIIIASSNLQNSLESKIVFEKNAVVKGQVFNNNCNLQLSGKVFGHVFTNNLFYKSSSSINTNLIFDTTLDTLATQKKYYGLLETPLANDIGIINWLEHKSLDVEKN